MRDLSLNRRMILVFIRRLTEDQNLLQYEKDFDSIEDPKFGRAVSSLICEMAGNAKGYTIWST